MLVAAGVAFEDSRFTFEEFQKMKDYKSDSNTLDIVAQFPAWPMPVCPLLENDEGRVMQQSLAIGQFVAQKYG